MKSGNREAGRAFDAEAAAEREKDRLLKSEREKRLRRELARLDEAEGETREARS